MKAPSVTSALGGGNKLIPFLTVLLLVFIVLGSGTAFYITVQNNHDKQYLSAVAEQQLLSQRLTAYAPEAASGEQTALSALARLKGSFEAQMTKFLGGNTETGLPAAPEPLQDDVQRLAQHWTQYREHIDTILNGRDALAALNEFVRLIQSSIPRLITLSDEIVDIVVKNKADPKQIAVTARQTMLAQRIGANLGQMLSGGDTASVAASQLGHDVALFGRVLDGLLKGNTALGIAQIKDAEARKRLRDISGLYSKISERVGNVLENSPRLFQIKAASSSTEGLSNKLMEDAKRLETAILKYDSRLDIYTMAAFGLGGLSILLLLIIGYQLVQDAKQRMEVSAEQNRRNQRAILQLLDEMTNLAEGDLTVHATVTEDITGAIADSVNYSIDALRKLVTTINATAVEVSSSSENTKGTAQRLADASNYQAREIASASAAIADMAESIEQVSKNAASSAEVAQRSVAIAHKGAQTVSRTIDGMGTIREQIQETSKRIKRLGESSQEIGDIVSLINDIADQTNILALNAAIQASTAGEAGRGFAVVADEVQRLAERAGNATKQIEALVKTIQSDTNEAVISMEHSTANVVSGAKLAEDGGEALSEIEGVSTQLATLIQSISQAARQQSSAAANITNTMNVIQEITMQTSEGTNDTANSVGKLTELATELRNSVAGFKLPDTNSEDTLVIEELKQA
jgi:twitching motility protein PilJ